MLSKRLTIQWPPEEAGENTVTMVVYSKLGHFVDIRVFKENYPVIEENPTSLDMYIENFEWTMTGDEIVMEPTIPDTFKLQFTHEIDSMAIIKSITCNLPVEDCATDPDVGTFWKVPGSDDRKETGSMLNPATGKVQEYVEMWRSLDDRKHTPTNEVREGKDTDSDQYVLRIEQKDFQGQLIRSGNWCQGILYDKLNKTVPLNVIRAYFDGEKWQYLIKYGSFKFPVDFAKPNTEIECDGLKWKCIE